MEQSSSFQLLVWSFSPSPTELLCVMRGCIWGLALHSLDTCLQRKTPYSLSVSICRHGLEVCMYVCVYSKHFFVSDQAAEAEKRLQEQLGNQTVILSSL